MVSLLSGKYRKVCCVHDQILLLLIVFEVLLFTCKLQGNHYYRSHMDSLRSHAVWTTQESSVGISDDIKHSLQTRKTDQIGKYHPYFTPNDASDSNLEMF